MNKVCNWVIMLVSISSRTQIVQRMPLEPLEPMTTVVLLSSVLGDGLRRKHRTRINKAVRFLDL